MSVAFRRDSDEEHLEPKFELPIPFGPNLVTVRGLGLIEARVSALESATINGLTEAEIAAQKRELRYWRARLATATVTLPAQTDNVSFGSTVHYLLNGKQQTVHIVGHDEADPAARMISFLSPLARAIMGAAVGDMIDFGGKADAIEITAIA
jgi:transcription elongation GreA/GreB family factor